MCGIAGFIQFQNPKCEEKIISNMVRTLVHRGPDEQGQHTAPHVALGHTRLSIIDLAGGTQPMHSPDRRYSLVFNGEIYNFRELRKELSEIQFSTNSDTEVLLHLLIEKGEKALTQLNGMFAFAFWDQQEKKLLLARDRFGKKPLYYYLTRDGIVFASELKALWQHPEVPRTLNPDAIRHFFTFENIPSPFAATIGSKKLQPGHFAFLTENIFNISRYYIPNFEIQKNIDERSACKELLHLLDLSIERRLISDVPLGVFLSGGIDSSAIVALMTRHREGKNIKTFSIHFDEISYDESIYSDEIAKRFGTDHHVETLSSKNLLEIFPSITKHLDEPFADHSILPTWLLCAHTKRHVTVALGGDGADEFFAGYPTFFADRMAQIVKKFPFFRKFLEQIAQRLPASENNMSLDFKLKQFLSGIDFEGPLRQQTWLSAFNEKESREYFTPNFLTEKASITPHALIQNELNDIKVNDPRHLLLAFYQRFYLSDDLLVKTDRASMAHSLEVRAPFLDPELTAFANSLPFNLKLKGITTKYILKKTFNRKLPALVTQRPKKGFGSPITGWLKREFKPLLEEKLSYKRLKSDGIFNPDAVWAAISRHISGARNERKPLFALLMLHLWMDEHGINL